MAMERRTPGKSPATSPLRLPDEINPELIRQESLETPFLEQREFSAISITKALISSELGQLVKCCFWTSHHYQSSLLRSVSSGTMFIPPPSDFEDIEVRRSKQSALKENEIRTPYYPADNFGPSLHSGGCLPTSTPRLHSFVMRLGGSNHQATSL